ncbi:MAG TPA: hypothetical protein VMO81_02280 [Aestuariivirgaceae bacterium]|nr:hypothetical protein [Aestuariivirgaceae bacterium]
MTGSDPTRRYAPKPNLVERQAAGYLKRRRQDTHAGDDRGTGDDQKGHGASLRRVQHRAVIWAAVAGILSGSVIGGSELLLRMSVPGELEELGWREQLPYWAGFFAFAGIISGLEILYLYWNALKSIARVRRIAGSDSEESRHGELVALGLARAGLEFPNPRVIIYGIDPYARLPNWRLTAYSILYRLKVGVTSFALRIILRRVFGRMMVRSLIPLFAGPLYAVWNAIITWRIIGEARLRAAGPAAVDRIVACMDAEGRRLSDRAVQLILQGTGELVMRACDAHPNYVLLLARLMEDREIEPRSIKPDWPKHRKELHDLDEAEQQVVLDVLTLASLLGSKLRRPQEEFLRELYGECGGTLQRDALKRLRSKLMDTEPVEAEDLAAVRS